MTALSNNKKILSQPAVMVLCALYMGILLNLPVYIRRFSAIGTSGGYKQAAINVSLEMLIVTTFVLCLLILTSLTGRHGFRVITSFLIFVSAIASYYMTFYNVIIGYGIIISVLSTDIDMSKEVIGLYSVGWGVLFGIAPLVLLNVYCSISPCTYKLVRTVKGITHLALLFFLCLGALFSSLQYFKMERNASRKGGNGEMANRTGVVFHSYVPSNWLAGLGMHAANAYEETTRRNSLFDPAKQYTYHASPDVEDTFVVFVIGETARYDHMSLFGYGRNTNPYLMNERNLVAIKGISSDTSTKLSLRTMFLRDGGYEPLTMQPKEENIFSVLKSLGFTSELFAMQGEMWFYNSVKADYYKLREVIAAEKNNTNKPIDDILLIPELQQSVSRHPKGKHLVILHTKGQHYLYTNRYPRSFAKFGPECMGVDSSCDMQKQINSYDNSLLYTDYFLSNVIKTLKDKKAIMFYTSDHGESIGENTHFHGTPKDIAPPEQRMVPFLVWASDKYLAVPDNRTAFQHLKSHEGEVRRHEELYDTMLGCLGYTSPDNGINKNNNWCQ